MMPVLAQKKQQQQKIRHAEYYDMIGVTDLLFQQSVDGGCFDNLMQFIAMNENILLAYRNIKKNRGSFTPGVDGITIEKLGMLTETQLLAKVKNKLAYYKPCPVKRKEIPKPNGKTRPLGIPTMIDRLIQQCVLQIMEPICEAKFHKRSNGFRPNRSAEHAIAQCNRLINTSGLHFVVDVDIAGFFDNVNHTKLRQQIWNLGIRDKKLLCIISEMLRAPIHMPDGALVYPEKGTPQGGILSPLLANIVLNELDWWIASQWETIPTDYQYAGTRHDNGTIGQGPKYKVLKRTGLKEMYIVRYADDFKILCRTRSDAQKILIAVTQWLKERLKLDISKEKSKITDLLKSRSEFLGFELKAFPNGKRLSVRSHMSKKAFENAREKLRAQALKINHPQDDKNEYEEISRYNAMVIGIQNYYQIATCISGDLARIAWQATKWFRQGKKEGTCNGYIKKRYGKSAQLRYIGGHAIAPIGYVQRRKAFDKKKAVNKYTSEGRTHIHDCLMVNMTVLLWLMRNPVINSTIEYADNRISLYSGQWGRCAVTGRELEIGEIHCHHKKPKWLGGNDSYHNLMLVSTDVHHLIHAVDKIIIATYLSKLQLTPAMLEKANKLRDMAGLERL